MGVPIGGHGSGTIVSSTGLILTAAHVVSDARVVAVLMPGSKTALRATVLYVNPGQDYAFLQVPGEYTKVAKLAPQGASLKVREEVFAVGYPLDSARSEAQSSRGAVSGRLPNGFLQLDIAVNAGNSGGPVISRDETVCGLIVARSDPETGAIGLAMALPAHVVRPKLEELRARPALPAPSETDRALAELVALLATDGPEWFKASVESSDSQRLQNQRVERLAEKLTRCFTECRCNISLTYTGAWPSTLG